MSNESAGIEMCWPMCMKHKSRAIARKPREAV